MASRVTRSQELNQQSMFLAYRKPAGRSTIGHVAGRGHVGSPQLSGWTTVDDRLG